MAPPVVYVVVSIVAATAAGVAFKQFVYDPHIKPKVTEWWEVQKARRQARRAQRQGLVTPHSSYSDDQGMRPRPSGDDGETLVELESLRPISKSSSVQSAFTGSDIRLRRVRPVSDEPSEVLDESVGELPFPPIQPVLASPSNRSSASSPLAQHVEPASFVLGADTPSHASEHSSPQVHIASLDSSPTHSPASVSTRVQLPTPPSEYEYAPQRPLSPEIDAVRSVSPEAPSTRVLSPSVLAPSMDNARSLSSHLSFVTANSPTSDFHSLSSPSQPNSPFSDSLSFSGDEDMYSFHTHSSDSLIRMNTDTLGTETHETMSTTEFEELAEVMSEGSSGSWEDVHPGYISPRH